MLALNGKVGLVTGDGSGIGRAIAEVFTDLGVQRSSSWISTRRASTRCAIASVEPDIVKGITADVTDGAQVGDSLPTEFG